MNKWIGLQLKELQIVTNLGKLLMYYSLSKFDRNSEGMYKLYDRFSFDEFFRWLLINDFEHSEALDFMLCNCSLSTLVYQERIENEYYLNISTEAPIAGDLVALRNQIILEILSKRLQHNKQLES